MGTAVPEWGRVYITENPPISTAAENYPAYEQMGSPTQTIKHRREPPELYTLLGLIIRRCSIRTGAEESFPTLVGASSIL